MAAGIMGRRTKLSAVISLTPTLTGLVGWYKADSLALSDGASVPSWADSSGTGNPMANATNQPIFKTGIQNGQPVVRFSGSPQVLYNDALTGFGALTAITLLSACSFGSNPTDAEFIAFRRTSNGLPIISNIESTGSVRARIRNDGGSLNETATTATSTTFHTFRFRWDGTTLDSTIDGGTLKTVAQSGTATFDQGSLGADRQGASNASFAVMDMGEVLVYSRALTTLEITNTLGYLKAKWGTP